MPSTLTEDPTPYLNGSAAASTSKRSSVEKGRRRSGERASSPGLPGSVQVDGTSNGTFVNGLSATTRRSGPNGHAAEVEAARKEDDGRSPPLTDLSRPSTIVESDGSQIGQERRSQRLSARDDGYFAEVAKTEEGMFSTHVMLQAINGGSQPERFEDDSQQETPKPNGAESSGREKVPAGQSSEPSTKDGPSRAASQPHRISSPQAFETPSTSYLNAPQPGRLQHRHTLEVPNATSSRVSRETTRTADEVITAAGRFPPSPGTPARRRASISLIRRVTRTGVQSDTNLDQTPHSEDADRIAEAIRIKRASKRRRRDDEDDDRVVMGTKVDHEHRNYVTAYNMLTGIRFTVSRTNAKLDRDLTDADFEAKHKFSFDVTGNELTPSAKYDFKFKDYAPWVFRHLRAAFKLDPADYLMSLTSKYILSELGSPGKSGSFFYFSRDYKYIIKTIHHAEHKCLRKILRDYYKHVQDNPNTLLSQFYGLHRVKVPYGRKIHFVVMNNLFPPHRDIHRTFDLKGSTIGRDFKEDDLEGNPRATLKDLNWLRRDMHLEFGPTKKRMFIEQMQRDVKILQRLKIMDYSLLIGIHDLSKGNEENLRGKTLQVFQPGGDSPETSSAAPAALVRTPSKLETARKAKELRQTLRNEKPVPMGQSIGMMPEEMTDSERRGLLFYNDDGGYRATHENDSPGEEIYYLGIIDCLTHYGFIKRLEHFIKGLASTESQISAIPPDRYGDRFVRFISGITKSRELAEQHATERNEAAIARSSGVQSPVDGAPDQSRPTSTSLPANHITTTQSARTDAVMERAERSAERSQRHGASEANVPERRLHTISSPPTDADNYTLPVVDEAAENGSTGGRSRQSQGSGRASSPLVLANDTGPKQHADVGEKAPPTPPKDGQMRLSSHSHNSDLRRYSGVKREGPPTPPKDEKPELSNTDKKERKKIPVSAAVPPFARGRVDPSM